jgi:hypothetical protein
MFCSSEFKHKVAHTTNFKKKKNIGKCFLCGSSDHFALDCKDRKDKQQQVQKKSGNVVISDIEKGTSGYGNHATVLSIVYQIGGLTPGSIYMGVLIFLYFLLTGSQGLDAC